jgi:ribosome hibernation promoting factor
MHIEYTGRQITITPALRSFTEEHMRKLNRVLRGWSELHVILAAEKHRRLAEITLKLRDRTLVGVAETNDAQASIKSALEKIERQVVRLFERGRARKRRPKPTATVLLNVLGSNNHHDDVRLLETEKMPLKPLTVEEAIDCLGSAALGVVVFRNTETDRVNVVYRRPDGNLTLIEPVAGCCCGRLRVAACTPQFPLSLLDVAKQV